MTLLLVPLHDIEWHRIDHFGYMCLFVETRRFVLTEDGSLEVHSVQGSDAGSYTCEVNYVYENRQMTTEINFMVYGK